MNTRNIIIAIIAIVILILGVLVFTQVSTQQDSAMSTEISFLSAENLKNGEAVQFVLKDKDGNTLANQNITIIFVENGENQTYSIVTDTNGQGSLVLNNEVPGTYEVIVNYNGTLTYDGCSAKQTITIEEGYSEPTTDDSSSETSSSEPVQGNSSAGTALYNGNSSSSSQNLHYDSQYNFYYDDNGIIRGGQNDGMSAEYIKNAYDEANANGNGDLE